MTFKGRDLSILPEQELAPLRAQEFGFVFQTFNLIPTLTGLENVETALVPFGLHPTERKHRAAAVLD